MLFNCSCSGRSQPVYVDVEFYVNLAALSKTNEE